MINKLNSLHVSRRLQTPNTKAPHPKQSTANKQRHVRTRRPQTTIKSRKIAQPTRPKLIVDLPLPQDNPSPPRCKNQDHTDNVRNTEELTNSQRSLRPKDSHNWTTTTTRQSYPQRPYITPAADPTPRNRLPNIMAQPNQPPPHQFDKQYEAFRHHIHVQPSTSHISYPPHQPPRPHEPTAEMDLDIWVHFGTRKRPTRKHFTGTRGELSSNFIRMPFHPSRAINTA